MDGAKYEPDGQSEKHPEEAIDGELIYDLLLKRPGKVRDTIQDAARRLHTETDEASKERIKRESYELIKPELFKVSLIHSCIQAVFSRNHQGLAEFIRTSGGPSRLGDGSAITSPEELLDRMGGSIATAVALYDSHNRPQNFWDELSRATDHLLASGNREEAEGMIWCSSTVKEEIYKWIAFRVLYAEGKILELMPSESEKPQ
jgi:hypothetical protein